MRRAPVMMGASSVIPMLEGRLVPAAWSSVWSMATRPLWVLALAIVAASARKIAFWCSS